MECLYLTPRGYFQPMQHKMGMTHNYAWTKLVSYFHFFQFQLVGKDLTANSVVLVEITYTNDFEPQFTSGDLNAMVQQNVGYPGTINNSFTLGPSPEYHGGGGGHSGPNWGNL